MSNRHREMVSKLGERHKAILTRSDLMSWLCVMAIPFTALVGNLAIAHTSLIASTVRDSLVICQFCVFGYWCSRDHLNYFIQTTVGAFSGFLVVLVNIHSNIQFVAAEVTDSKWSDLDWIAFFSLDGTIALLLMPVFLVFVALVKPFAYLFVNKWASKKPIKGQFNLCDWLTAFTFLAISIYSVVLLIPYPSWPYEVVRKIFELLLAKNVMVTLLLSLAQMSCIVLLFDIIRLQIRFRLAACLFIVIFVSYCSIRNCYHFLNDEQVLLSIWIVVQDISLQFIVCLVVLVIFNQLAGFGLRRERQKKGSRQQRCQECSVEKLLDDVNDHDVVSQCDQE